MLSRQRRHDITTGERSVTRPPAYLSKHEVERFFSAIPKTNIRDRLLFSMMYRYGLRRREAALLRRGHLSEHGIWIWRAKGGVSGEYPVDARLRRQLDRYLSTRVYDGSPYLFTTRQSGFEPISTSTIYAAFRRYASAAALPTDERTVHVLRHSIAVHMMNAGLDAADVQDWLGHRDITSTMVYAAITNKRRFASYTHASTSAEVARI